MKQRHAPGKCADKSCCGGCTCLPSFPTMAVDYEIEFYDEFISQTRVINLTSIPEVARGERGDDCVIEFAATGNLYESACELWQCTPSANPHRFYKFTIESVGGFFGWQGGNVGVSFFFQYAWYYKTSSTALTDCSNTSGASVGRDAVTVPYDPSQGFPVISFLKIRTAEASCGSWPTTVEFETTPTTVLEDFDIYFVGDRTNCTRITNDPIFNLGIMVPVIHRVTFRAA